MRNIQVVMQGAVRGTYSQDKVVASMRAGQLDGATFFDAQGGGLVTPDELLSGSLQAAPWNSRETDAGPSHPTSRYQRLAMEENNRETKNLHDNPYTIGQEGYTSQPTQEYLRRVGGSPQSYGSKPNAETPWGGIVAVVVALVFWPMGLVLGFRARSDAQKRGKSTTLSTAAIIISICGAAVLGLMIYNANAV